MEYVSLSGLKLYRYVFMMEYKTYYLDSTSHRPSFLSGSMVFLHLYTLQSLQTVFVGGILFDMSVCPPVTF